MKAAALIEAVKMQDERDERLARMIRSEIVEAWNKGR